MHLQGARQVQEWLQGHFPNIDWSVAKSLYKEKGLIVGAYVNGKLEFSVYVGDEPHTTFLDLTIEWELDARPMLSQDLKGEYVQYNPPEPVL